MKQEAMIVQSRSRLRSLEKCALTCSRPVSPNCAARAASSASRSIASAMPVTSCSSTRRPSSLDDHSRYSAVACGHDRQPARTRFEDGDRRPLGITRRRFDGMLHEGARAPHLVLNHAMRLRLHEGDGRSDPQPARQIATCVEERPVPDHPEAGLRIPSMDAGERKDRQLRRFLFDESSDREEGRSRRCR